MQCMWWMDKACMHCPNWSKWKLVFFLPTRLGNRSTVREETIQCIAGREREREKAVEIGGGDRLKWYSNCHHLPDVWVSLCMGPRPPSLVSFPQYPSFHYHRCKRSCTCEPILVHVYTVFTYSIQVIIKYSSFRDTSNGAYTVIIIHFFFWDSYI